MTCQETPEIITAPSREKSAAHQEAQGHIQRSLFSPWRWGKLEGHCLTEDQGRHTSAHPNDPNVKGRPSTKRPYFGASLYTTWDLFLLPCHILSQFICASKCIRGNLRVYCEVASYKIERERARVDDSPPLLKGRSISHRSKFLLRMELHGRNKPDKTGDTWRHGTPPRSDLWRINQRSFKSWESNSLSRPQPSANKVRVSGSIGISGTKESQTRQSMSPQREME